MSTTVERPARHASSNRVDKNGVPTIASAIPLVLLGAGLLFGVPIVGLQVIGQLIVAATGEARDGTEIGEFPSDYRWMLGTTGVLRMLFLGWLCLAIYRFFGRRSSAPWTLMTLFAAAIGLNLLEGFWEAWLWMARGDSGRVADVIVRAVAPLIMGVIWLIYFWRSKSVKRVFVYPLEEPVEDAA